MKLPKQSSKAELGELGLNIVKKIVESDFNWIFRKNHQEHDYGIDAFIDLTTDLRQVTGKSIAIQVKTGDSYFTETNSFGWIYRDDIEHLNYYLNHQIPVVIILVNVKTGNAFWCLCDSKKTEKAGNSWKITIPFSQELTVKFKDIIHQYVSPVIDYASQLENFWAQNKMLKKFDRIILIVDKQSILNKQFHEISIAIDRLKVNESLIEAFNGAIDIGIHGYDDDPRELYEIKEVKEWTNLIFKNITGLTYFLTTDDLAQFFRVLQFCKMGFKILPGQKIGENGFLNKTVEVNTKNFKPFLDEAFIDLNKFTEENNLSDNVNEAVSKRIGEYITGMKWR